MAMTMNTSPAAAARITAVDVMRGGVVLLLVPDIAGGFSFYAMARQHPTEPAWTLLADLFSHVAWAGVTPWDLVMPAFVFLVGVSLALSVERRRQDGDSNVLLLAHALLRSTTLVALGMLLTVKPVSHVDEALPYLLLACALPWSRWIDA